MDPQITEAVGTSLHTHLLTVGGFILAIFAIARLVGEKRPPSNTVAWLLMIILIPYVGVPLFLLFGGRKIKRLAKRKRPVAPRLSGVPAVAPEIANLPTAHTLASTGAGAPSGGNAVRLLTTGEQTYAELEALIKGAQHSIHIAAFILGRDDTGKRLVKLLAKRAREGVKVRACNSTRSAAFSPVATSSTPSARPAARSCASCQPSRSRLALGPICATTAK